MAILILLNKPFQVLPQFSDDQNRSTLAHYLSWPGVYPAGRLDYDSEGLMLLTDNGKLQQQISNPTFKLAKTYWVQVEGIPDDATLGLLRQGVALKEGRARPAKVSLLSPPEWLWPRTPPIRYRENETTQWLKMEITEGRNRQVRRMTAAIGHPTLRLIRSRIGNWSLGELAPGEWRQETVHLPASPRPRKSRPRRR